ncbi:hypothetical protein ABVT39_020589 [Epinephelus coioides]
MTEIATQNQRASVEHIKGHMKKKVAKVVLDYADQITTQTEGKTGTLMAQLITKSNTLRKRYKEKTAELQKVKEKLTKACRSMP